MLRQTIAALLPLLAMFAACNGSVGSPLTTSNACASLVACCGTLATGGSACVSTAENNVVAVCSAALTNYTTLGLCGTGTGPGTGGTSCASLAVCCAAMSPTLAAGCDAVVTAGVNASCASELTAFTTTGACAGSGPGTSSGSTVGTGPGTGTGSSTIGIGSTASTGPGSDSGTGPGSGTGTGTGDAGKVPECAVPSSFPSGGSCVTVVATNDAGTGIQCNPVTNAPCASGYACDIAGVSVGDITGFECYPPPNTALVCATCDGSTTFCAGGTTCYEPTSGATTGTCAHYCCTNADCGAGTCTTGGFAPASSAIGVCTMP
jgi:hypothetical protein